MVRRRFAIPLVVVASVAAGGIGGAILGVPGLSGASTSSTSATTPSSVPDKPGGRHGFGLRGPGGGDFDAAAKALNLTTEQLMQKLSDGTTTIADIAKQENIPLDTVVNAIAAADHDRIEQFVNNPLPKFGPGGPGGPGKGFGFFGGGAATGQFDAVAKALGITTKELMTDLRNGQSIADVAKAKNVDINTVIDDMVTAAQQQINDAKNAGKLSDAQATKLLTNLKQRITDLVNRKIGDGDGMGFGHFRTGGRRGPGGPLGGAPGAPDAPANPTSLPLS